MDSTTPTGQSPADTEALPTPSKARRIAMIQADLTGAAVAKALQLSEGAVSQTLNGYQLDRPSAQRVMAYIAERLGKTIEELWPERSIAGTATSAPKPST